MDSVGPDAVRPLAARDGEPRARVASRARDDPRSNQDVPQGPRILGADLRADSGVADAWLRHGWLLAGVEQAAAGARWCREHDSELAQFVEDESAWTKRGARRPAEQQRVHFELAAAADPSEDLEALMRRATPMLVDTSRIWQGTPVAWKRRARR